MNQENKMTIEYIYNDLVITLNNEILTLEEKEKIKKIKEKEFIDTFKNIFVKYKDKLLKFSNLQKSSDEFSSNKMLIGGPTEIIHGIIDNIEIYVNASYKNDELNDMFKNIYLEINSFIKKTAQIENTKNISSIEIIKNSPTLSSNSNDEFYISINSNGESNVTINGIKYKINEDKIKSILDGISKNYIVFKTMSENQNGEGILGGESYIMTLSSDFEKIQINNTLLSIENQKSFDGFVDLLIEEIKTQNKGSDDNMNDEKLKKIVEEVIGNNDPFWNKPVFEVVKKIIEMPNETESSISKLLGTSQYSSKQLFDIYHCVNKVCKRINIVLDFSKENAKVDGLLYNLPFTKRIANKNFICPNCSEPLTFIKFGTILYCKKCNKNYERNNDSVGNEISSIWSNENKSEISNNNVNDSISEQIKDTSVPKILTCPICNANLMYLEPDGTTLYCRNCNKNFKNNNGSVGGETTSPYTDSTALY